MSSVIHRWAIRQKSTGFYLPAPKGRGGRGGTHVDPADPTAPDFEPRLFPTELAAKHSLRWWLGGKVTVDFHRSWDGLNGYDDCEDWKIEKVPGRDPDDMEIVHVKVELP